MTRNVWRGVAGAVLTVVLLAWTLRDVHWAEFRAQVAQANVLLLVVSAIAATAIFPMRAARWRVLLEPIDPGLGFMAAWRATAIGMMVNNVVPARAGEVARAWTLTQTTRIPFASALASIALDRVFDALVVFALMFAAMLDPQFPPGATIMGRPATALVGGWGVAVLGVVLAGAAVAVFAPAIIHRMVNAVTARLVPAQAARVTQFVEHALAGLAVLRSPSRFLRVLAWTLVHWLTNALAFWIAFRAVGITAPFSAALFLQGLIAVGVAIPSSPGFFGPFEAFAKIGLTIYGVPTGLAVVWAVGFHLLAFVPITAIGAAYLSRLGLSLGALRRGAADAQHAA